MKQYTARSWAMFSCIGLLAASSGCQSQTSSTEPPSSAAKSPLKPTESVDPGVPGSPAVANADAASVAPSANWADRTIDGDIQRTSGGIATPAAVAPTVDQAVVEVDKSVKDIANDLKSNATQAAGEISQGVADEVTQAADGLKQKAVAGTRKTTDDFLNKLDSEANSALNRVKGEVKKQLGKSR